MSKILITGAAGFIGAHTAQALFQQGHNIIIFDNLSNGFKEQTLGLPLIVGDLCNKDDIQNAFELHRDIDAVIHFAGLIEAGRSVQEPEIFHNVNVGGTRNLLEAMQSANVTKLVFSSTAAVYGTPTMDLITEDHPLEPINPYGETKKQCEELIHNAHHNWGLKPAILRYFNAAGSDPEARIGERHDPETHLIPLVIDAILGKCPPLQIFGDDYDTPDGTCVRDYIHVCDLADAHVKALRKLDDTQTPIICNLGTGKGFSVKDVITSAENILSATVPHTRAPRRAGDPPKLVCSNEKARELLGWNPQYPDLADMIKHCYAFRQKL